MTSSFTNAVNQHDIITVRLSLSDELMLNPHGEEFDIMLQKAEENLSDLYQIDNGKSYQLDKSLWDKKFLYNLKNDLDTNFSKEKLCLYKKVVSYIYSAESNRHTLNVSDNNVTVGKGPRKRIPQSNNNDIGLLYPGLMIGGALIGITGICVSKIALTTIGAAGFAYGSFMYLKKSKR